MKCSEIDAMLPAYAGESDLPLNVRRHLSRCADCRAEMARYEQMSSALQALPTLAVEPPASLRAALISIPAEAGRLEALRAHVSRNRKTYAGLAVTAVGAAGAALWRTRRSRIATA
jgi:hypothetical protein